MVNFSVPTFQSAEPTALGCQGQRKITLAEFEKARFSQGAGPIVLLILISWGDGKNWTCLQGGTVPHPPTSHCFSDHRSYIPAAANLLNQVLIYSIHRPIFCRMVGPKAFPCA